MGTLSNFLRTLAIILVAILLVLLFFIAVIYIGWQNGQTQRRQFEQATLAYKVERQQTLVAQDMLDIRYDRAEVRLDWLATQQPMDPMVVQWRSTIEAAKQAENLPTETPTATPTIEPPTPTPIPVTTLNVTSTPSAEEISKQLAKITGLTEDKKWEDAISAILSFQIENPNYKRLETDQLLFDSYVAAGFQATNGEQVSLGISYFELASKLGKLPENVKTQLYYARLYQQAISYSNIRWDYTIGNYQEICANLPNFHNACYLVYQSQLKAGTQFVKAGEGCPAISYLQAAYNYDGLDKTNQLLGEAIQSCSLATTTPIPTELWEIYGSPTPFTSTIDITLTVTPNLTASETIEASQGTPTIEPTEEETLEGSKTPDETPTEAEETPTETVTEAVTEKATVKVTVMATETPNWNATTDANRKPTPNWNATADANRKPTPNWNATATQKARSNQP